MKFWQKSFLGILAIFIISINTCLYLNSKYSYELNLNKDIDRALSEYHVIMNGVYETMSTISFRGQNSLTPSSIESFMRSYADYYNTQKVYLELRQSNQILFTNLQIHSPDNQEIEKNAYTTKVLSIDGKYYLFIFGKVDKQFDAYTLTYVRDLSELYQTHSQLTKYLITVTLLVEISLVGILFIFLRKLTAPIRKMQKVTREIVNGNYDIRVNIPGKDEFHDLSENFNHMAYSIQEKIFELYKNAQDKQHLIDNLAHELRTPLTAIMGYAEYLQKANTSEQKRIIATNYIIHEADRMKNMAFKLLDIALVRNGQLDVKSCNLHDLFCHVQNVLTSKLKEKDIQLNIQLDIDHLMGDEILLQSLFINLVDNAIKASSPGSHIEISAFMNLKPTLQIKDKGHGMEKSQIALICEPFYRVDKARARSVGSIGLGLSLCREIVLLHGAELKFDSIPQKGTIVSVIFTSNA